VLIVVVTGVVVAAVEVVAVREAADDVHDVLTSRRGHRLELVVEFLASFERPDLHSIVEK
jgi:hypothetical protein